jgi:hypothetical protein
MTRSADVQHGEAERIAAAARTVSDNPGLQAAFARLEAHYTAQFRQSEPKDEGGRESAYFMLRALDALRGDIAAAVAGAAVARRNLRSRLTK